MNSLNSFLSGDFSRALGWTLIHSLWQGLLIGLLVLLILTVRRGAGPQFKYLVRVMGLTAILISAFLTFTIEFRQEEPVPVTGDPSGHLSGYEVPLHINKDSHLAFSEMKFTTLRYIMQVTFPWISLVWFLGVCVLSLRLTGGMIHAGRLRTRNVSPLPSGLERRFGELIRRSGVTRPVSLKVSREAIIPMVIGALRPVILFPAAMISLMPVEQLDSILAHEIAHIKRFDFLVNVIQSVMEVLFFYHPAVWILSEGIRREREKCCDDSAIDLCGNLSTYARALAGLSELQAKPVLPSVALTRRKNQLLNRVERLIKQKKMKTNASEKIVAGMLILGSAVILTLGTGASLKPEKYGQGASLQLDLRSYARQVSPAPVAGEPEKELSRSLVPAAEPARSAELTPPEGPAPVTEAATATALSPETGISGESIPGTGAVKVRRSMAGDTLSGNSCRNMQVEDNVVTREFVNAEGKEMEMKFVIREGKVRELYVDGDQVPEENFTEYQKEIDRTMKDLKQMERDLKKARTEIESIDLEEIQKEIQAQMEHFRQEDMEKLREEMKKLQQEKLDIQLDHEKIQKEILKAMEESRIDQQKLQEEIMKASEEAMEKLKTLDEEKIQEQIERQLEEIRKIDVEQVRKQVEMAMKEIDLEEIQKNVQKSMEEMKLHSPDMERKTIRLDEMIDELEKLELGED